MFTYDQNMHSSICACVLVRFDIDQAICLPIRYVPLTHLFLSISKLGITHLDYFVCTFAFYDLGP